jgi:hypothetical protein
MAVDEDPERRHTVNIAVPLNVYEIRSVALFNNQGRCIGIPFHLCERMPDVLLIPFC